jgi:uncharacterized protein (TIGR02569 family)
LTDLILPPGIKEAFYCHGETQRLAGGEGRSFKVGPCVFKPIENPERYSWSCELLLNVPQVGFRIAEPRRTRDGSFVFRGWGASDFVSGEHVQGRWHEKLEILRLFHTQLQELENTPIPPSDDRWSLAHEIAWQVIPLPTEIHPDISNLINALFFHYQPLPRGQEIIHSDFSGNTLFHFLLDPCVIDFSPAYGSIEYAETIMIADAIAWEQAPLEIISLLRFDEHYRQNLLRAINFRLIVTALFYPRDIEPFLVEYAAFNSLIEFACHLP